MKSALALVVVMVLFAAPAFAGDGNVPQEALSALGLGGMQVVSDAEGMQVRGMSSSTHGSYLFVFSGLLHDPETHSEDSGFGVVFAFQSATNGGVNDRSQFEFDLGTDGVGIMGDLDVTVSSFTGTFSVGAGGFWTGFAE